MNDEKLTEADIADQITRMDVAIEILSSYKGLKIKALLREMQKPEEQRDKAAVERLLGEMKTLSHERMLMYRGDAATIDKIYKVYSPALKERDLSAIKLNSASRGR